MEIRFDPLNEREAHAVAMFLTPTIRKIIHHETPSDMRDDQWHRETPVVDLDIAAMFGTVKTDEKSMAARHAATVVGTVQAENTSSKFSPAAPPDIQQEVTDLLNETLMAETRQAIVETTLQDDIRAGQVAAAMSVTGFIPLPFTDAPLPAAADMFATAPAVPSPGQASTPIVPPPPAVPAPPPVAALTAPAAETNPAGVDKNGLPWDPRIHSGTKAVNADGSWRQRRGLNDPELVKRVEDELRAMMLITSHPGISRPGDDEELDEAFAAGAVVVPPPPVMPGNVPPPPPVILVPPSSPPATAPIPSPPAVPAPPTVAASGAPITFAELMTRITKAIREGKVTEAQINAGLVTLGLKEGEMGMLAGKVDLRSRMADYVGKLLGGL